MGEFGSSPDMWDAILRGEVPFEPTKVNSLPEEAMIGDWVEWEGTIFIWVGHWQKIGDVEE